MKYIKTIKDNRVVVTPVPNTSTEKDLPEGAAFTTKKFYHRVRKFNLKLNVSGGTPKGIPQNIIRAVTAEHLKYGNMFKKENGKIVRANK
jgi:hypothetical protein